jgi:hypothetical protein
MKVSAFSFCAKPTFALALFLFLPSVARTQSSGVIPTIKFQTVPISTAVQNLAQMADINYIIDPKLFQAADGSLKPEPSLTLNWTNVTAAEALARLLKEHDLMMTTNPFTAVVEITGTNHVACRVDARLLGPDTNGVLPMIRFGDVPLNMALTTLARQAGINAALDPQVSGDAPPAPPDFKLVRVPLVSVRWQNLTARQAIVELCEMHGLTIVKSPAPDAPDALVIKPKN